MTGGTIDPSLFRHVLGHHPTGICVITAFDDEPVGMAVGSFMSVSLSPPLVAFLPDRRSRSFPRIQRARKFCANILNGSQSGLCARFATSGGNKFEGVDYRMSSNGSPILDGVQAWVDCEIRDVFDAGDHLFVSGLVLELEADSSLEPMVFYRGSYGRFLDLS